MQPLVLDGKTYTNMTSLAIHQNSDENIRSFTDIIGKLGAGPIDTNYDGSYRGLLEIFPNMAAFNVNSISIFNTELIAMYNDSYTHSLPVIINLLSNVILK